MRDFHNSISDDISIQRLPRPANPPAAYTEKVGQLDYCWSRKAFGVWNDVFFTIKKRISWLLVGFIEHKCLNGVPETGEYTPQLWLF